MTYDPTSNMPSDGDDQPTDPGWPARAARPPYTPPAAQPPQPAKPKGLRQMVRAYPWAAGVFGLILVACVALCALVVLASPGNNSATTNPTATGAATKTPRPTATVVQTLQSVVTKIATEQATNGSATNVKVEVDAVTRTVTVTATVGEQLNHDAGVTISKSLIFDVQHNLWTSPTVARLGGLNGVDVVVLGPVQDKYGNPSTGRYAEADLTSATAQLFSWDNLDYDTAWGDYDYTYVIPQ